MTLKHLQVIIHGLKLQVRSFPKVDLMGPQSFSRVDLMGPLDAWERSPQTHKLTPHALTSPLRKWSSIKRSLKYVSHIKHVQRRACLGGRFTRDRKREKNEAFDNEENKHLLYNIKSISHGISF